MKDPTPAHAGWFRDVRRIIDVTEVTPGLPLPRISPSRASFDYRHVIHERDAREAVAIAVAVLGYAFGAVFAEETQAAGDDTPRYLLEALLPSGLALVIISRFTHAGLLEDLLDSAQAEPELSGAAA